MNKLLSILGVLALLGGGAYYLKSKSSLPNEQPTNKLLSEAQQFAQAIESGKPTQCVMTKGEDKMEFKIKGKQTKISTPTGHMINDGTYLYTWDDKTQQGAKILIPQEEIVASNTPSPSSPTLASADDYALYQNQGYTINCSAQNFDDSVFLPPANIEFIDPTELMRAIPSPNAAGEFDLTQLQELKDKIQLPVESPIAE